MQKLKIASLQNCFLGKCGEQIILATICQGERVSRTTFQPLACPNIRVKLVTEPTSNRKIVSMQMNKDLEKKYQEQITMEFEASLTYRQLAIEADEQDLPGISAWFHSQAEEETEHALKFINFVGDRDNHASIGAIEAPEIKAGLTPVEMFEAALAHEQKVSASIRDLYKAAEEAGDFESRNILNWFMDEQIEEEATCSEILAQLKMIGNDGSGLLRLDSNLSARKPALTEAE